MLHPKPEHAVTGQKLTFLPGSAEIRASSFDDVFDGLKPQRHQHITVMQCCCSECIE